MNEKSSCPVLRGRDGGNTILLLDNLSGTKPFAADFDEAFLSKFRSEVQDTSDAKLEGTIMKDGCGLDSTRLAEYGRRGAIIGESSTRSQDTDQDHEAPAPPLRVREKERTEATGKNEPSVDTHSS